MTEIPIWKPPFKVEPSDEYEACLNASWLDLGRYFDERNLDWSFEDRLAYFKLTELFLVTHQQDVGFFMILKKDQRFCIADIHVFTGFRNQGYGGRIIRYIKNLAASRDYHRIWLDVFQDNPAIRLYEICGFKIEVEQQSGYTMSCELS